DGTLVNVITYEQEIIEADLVGEVPYVIKNITGVIGFLGTKQGKPVPLRPAEVNRILGKVDELAESDAELNIPFIIGETVKVIDGPFNSFTGVIENINEEKKKLKVIALKKEQKWKSCMKTASHPSKKRIF
ncbi:MAG: KOW motif-containing protein, partial [Bacteroidetes bacterium]|nr:KOW motif-containing protein [Bacteroidota bacterium]